MALAQLTQTSTIGSPTPKLEISSSNATYLLGTTWSACCWANCAITDATIYQDLIAYSDDNNVVGFGLKQLSGSTYNMLLGDLNTDNVGATAVTLNQWWHLAFSVQPTAAGTSTCYGYLNGRKEIGPVTLTPPNGVLPWKVRLWNSRASTTDGGSVWVGRACAFKIWDGVALDADDFRREMGSIVPVQPQGLWAWTPAFDAGSRALILGGRAGSAWTTTGTFATDGDPPIGWDYPPARRRVARFNPPPVESSDLLGMRVCCSVP